MFGHRSSVPLKIRFITAREHFASAIYTLPYSTIWLSFSVGTAGSGLSNLHQDRSHIGFD
jgi:hypothetical protein